MTKVFFFQAEDGIRDGHVTGVQTCALPISHPEMGYRSCLGIIRLAEEYSSTRMEAAADRAIRTGACRYKSVKSILKNSLDLQPLPELPLLPLPPSHDNIRGAEYFESKGEMI